MNDLSIMNTDQLEELLTLTLSKIPPGKSIEKMLGIKNNTSYDLTSIIASFWPGMRNNQVVNTIGSPVSAASVIVNDYTGNMQVVSVAETDSEGELTEYSTRGPCYLFDGSSTYTNYTSGSVSCMADTDDVLLIGFQFPHRNIRMEFSAFGSYGALTFEKTISTGWGALPGSAVDGTNGFSQDGNIYLGDSVETTWVRTTINGVGAYWIRVSAASVTTQAVADVLHDLYVYQHDYPCLFGQGVYYSFDGATSWVQIYPNFEYSNMGIVAFNTDPTASGTLAVHSNYSYKVPSPGTYNLTFSYSSGWLVSVNGGANISVTADGSYVNRNIISGLGIVLSSGITASDTATFYISDFVEYLWYADDSGGSPGTWQNYDYTIGDIDSEETIPFWIKIEPFSTVDIALNLRYLIQYAYCSN